MSEDLPQDNRGNPRAGGTINPSRIEEQLRELDSTREAILNILEDTSVAKDALAESEARYRDLYEYAPIMYHTIDLEGNILECNEQVLTKLGYSREEYVGHNIREFLAPQYRGVISKAIEKIVKDERVEGLRRDYVRKDGSLLPAELSVSVIKDEQGRPVALRGALVDISDRLEKERYEQRVLIESQLRSETFRISSGQGHTIREMEKIFPEIASSYREILQAEAIAIFHYSAKEDKCVNCALDANQEVLKKMKQHIPSFEEIMTFPVSKNKKMMKIMKGKKAVVLEGFLSFGRTKKIKVHDALFPDSKVVMIPVKSFGQDWGLIALVVSPDSHVLEMTAAIRENMSLAVQRIEEWNARLRDQKEREESEAKFRSVVEYATDIIVQNDLGGNYAFANPATERIIGYSQEELLKMNYADIMHPEDAANVRQLFEQQFRDRTPEIEFEARITTKSGEMKWLRARSRLIWEAKRIVGWQSIARDVTDRKLAEQKAEERRRRIQAINEASQFLVSTLDFQEVAKKCGSLARELVDVDGATIFLMNSAGTQLEPIVAIEPYEKEVMSMTLKLGEGITGKVAQSGKSEIVNRADLSARAKQVPGTPREPESLLSAPLKTKDRTIGVITLRRSGMRQFTEEDLVFLENLANISAAAIENARLYESVQQSEEDYRSLVETTVDPVVAIDESSRVLLWNEAATSTFGIPRNEMEGRSIRVLFDSPEAFKRHRADLRRFLKTGKSEVVGKTREIRARHKDGHLIDLIISISARRTVQGRVFTSIMKDITEAKQARREIERLAQFPRENPLPVVETDSQGALTYVNPAGEDFLREKGLERDQIDRILPENYKELAIEHLEKDTNIPPQEVQVDSSVLLWTGHPIQSLQLVHFYAADITELKETERKVIEARDRAEMSDRLKNVFLSTMSHEVRTPLNVILGYTDLLDAELQERLSDLSSEMRGFFGSIRESGERLKHLIDDILDISQIEADQVVLDFRIYNADEIIKKSVAEIVVPARENGIEVIEQYGAPKARLNVDKVRLQQAVGNLLQNALKFTREGSITVATSASNGEYSVAVTDTGIGIREDFIPYLFTLFRQAEEGYGRSYEGAGLGLAITHRLVTAMGGRIEVESEKGKGSTFTIFLPVSEKRPAVRKKAKKAVLPEEVVPTERVGEISLPGEEPQVERKKVLLVEDNVANLKYLEFLVKRLGFEYLSAESGEQALDLLKGDSVDCMLIDISLAQGMSGVEFLHRVNRRKKFKEVPKIAVTAHAMKGKREEYLEEGFSDYLAKPFTLKELRDLMARTLKS